MTVGVDLHPGRTLVMGVLNVTPDSFSDGGRWLDPERAVAHGLEMVRQGADIVDVGGESTRPGAPRVDLETELERVVPVVRDLVAEGVTVSVDTTRSAVAEACLQAGAHLVNDVSGGLAEPDMAGLVASAGVPYVAMHWRGHSDRMNDLAVYDDVVAEVVAELRRRVDAVVAAGVPADRVIVDPGLGFSKDAGHNWTLLGRLDAFTAMGFPLLVGASRKRFLGVLDRSRPDARPSPPLERDAATAATSLLAAQAGAWAVRVHDVPSSRDAVLVWEQVQRARR